MFSWANISFTLYLTKMGQLTKSHFCSAGKSLISIGTPGNYPVQTVYWMNVKNPSEFAKGFGDYQSEYSPKNSKVIPSSFDLGESPYGETHYILVGVESLMELFDIGKYGETNKTAISTWYKFIQSNQSNVEIV